MTHEQAADIISQIENNQLTEARDALLRLTEDTGEKRFLLGAVYFIRSIKNDGGYDRERAVEHFRAGKNAGYAPCGYMYYCLRDLGYASNLWSKQKACFDALMSSAKAGYAPAIHAVENTQTFWMARVWGHIKNQFIYPNENWQQMREDLRQPLESKPANTGSVSCGTLGDEQVARVLEQCRRTHRKQPRWDLAREIMGPIAIFSPFVAAGVISYATTSLHLSGLAYMATLCSGPIAFTLIGLALFAVVAYALRPTGKNLDGTRLVHSKQDEPCRIPSPTKHMPTTADTHIKHIDTKPTTGLWGSLNSAVRACRWDFWNQGQRAPSVVPGGNDNPCQTEALSLVDFAAKP